MSDQSKYHLPEFITRGLSNGGSLSENDIVIINDIYRKAENFSYPSSKTEQNWQKVKSRINQLEQPSDLTFVRGTNFNVIMKWAVAAIIVLSVSIGIFQFANKPLVQMSLIQNTQDKLKKITLTDGTIVTLNTFSSLSANNFNSDERIVTMSGEAYFEVVHNNKPFIVKTTAGSIKVLGTKFNVKSRKNTPFQVALSSGNIIFSTSEGRIELKPGDIVTSGPDHSFIKSSISQSTLSWLDQKLVFENETLSNIVSALESQYNITLEYDQKLKTEKLTLTFNQLTAQQAADLLSKTLNSKVIVK